MAEDEPTSPDPDASGPNTPDAPDEGDVRTRLAEAQLEEAMDGYHALRSENAELRSELDDLRDKQHAANQDMGASLERQKRAAARQLRTEREGIYSRYIEILDNFDRAFDTVEARGASHSLMEGFILVRNQVVQVLKDGGFDRVRTLGLEYDPTTSEAMALEDVDDPTRDGIVIRELVRGYHLDDQIVRAAKVVVGRYVAPAKEDSGETLRIPEEDGKETPPVDAPEDEEG